MLTILLALNPSPMTLDGTRTFIVGRERVAVIDPGPDLPGHLDAILHALDGRTPDVILLTHGSPDHSGNAGLLMARTGAPLRMAPGTLVPLQETVTEWLRDGEQIATDTGVLQVVATPGHAPEHVCFLWTGGPPEHERALVAGDMFMGGIDTTLVAPPDGDLTQYLASLDRLEALRPSVLHPAHGPPIADGEEAIRRYRAHRASRIDQVVRALRQGPAAPGELIDRIYGDTLHPALRGAAEGSLRAILAHLTDTGRAGPAAGERYTLTER